MREEGLEHYYLRGKIAQEVDERIRVRHYADYGNLQVLAQAVYQKMGLCRPESALSVISFFRKGRAQTFQGNGNDRLSLNRKELDRLAVLFDALEVSPRAKIVKEIRERHSSFRYGLNPKTYTDSLDSARL